MPQLVIDKAAVLVPELLTPGKKPSQFGLLTARKVVRSFPFLEIAQVISDPRHVHGNDASWSNVATSHAGNIVVPSSSDTLTATSGFTYGSIPALYWVLKVRPTSVGNYYPSIINGTAWTGNAALHSETGGELYLGVNSGARITPEDTSAPIFVVGTWTRLSCGFGVHTNGISYGTRLAKDGSLLAHVPRGGVQNLLQPAITITGGIEIEYMVQLVDQSNSLNFAERDAEWLSAMNAIHDDFYNEVFDLS